MTAGTSHTTPPSVTLTPIIGFPEVHQGDDVAEILLNLLQDREIQLLDGDILVISSKVVSKAMGLRAPAAEQAAVVLSQTVRIVTERMTPAGVTRIVESAAGPVMTAAGVDASNTPDQSVVLVLPGDPDAAAARIRDRLQAASGSRSGTPVTIGVILSDTAGRPWRNGQTDFALGASGIRVMDDLRGTVDANGRDLFVTERCIADEAAAAADLVKGKATGVPAALIRGLGQYVHTVEVATGARSLVRTGPQDWFAYGSGEAVRAALGVQPGSAEATVVGLPSTNAEEPSDKARRALRVALLTCPQALGEVNGDTISLVARDEFTLGVVAARTEVALRGEGLTATMTRPGARVRAGERNLTSRAEVLIVFQ